MSTPKPSAPSDKPREFWIDDVDFDLGSEKPREWWLHNTDSAGDVYKWGFCSGTFDPAIKSVHVIEYSAYESVIEQLEQAKHTQQSAIDDLKEIIKERDALKEELYETNIKLDQEKFSHQNCFEHWHKALAQLAEVTRENVRLKDELMRLNGLKDE